MDDRERLEPVDILLIEDNPGDVRLTEVAFNEARIANDFHAVTNGAEALDFVNQRGRYESAPQPDLVLLDLRLPDMDGIDVLKEIKTDPELKTIPVIVLSGSDAQETVVESYQTYANAYLPKPIDDDDFIETVRALEQFWFTLVRLPIADDEDE